MHAIILLSLLAGAPVWKWEAVPYTENLPNRVTPPCAPATVFDGYCWAPTTNKVPCPAITKEYGGKCYAPLVHKATPPKK